MRTEPRRNCPHASPPRSYACQPAQPICQPSQINLGKRSLAHRYTYSTETISSALWHSILMWLAFNGFMKRYMSVDGNKFCLRAGRRTIRRSPKYDNDDDDCRSVNHRESILLLLWGACCFLVHRAAAYRRKPLQSKYYNNRTAKPKQFTIPYTIARRASRPKKRQRALTVNVAFIFMLVCTAS